MRSNGRAAYDRRHREVVHHGWCMATDKDILELLRTVVDPELGINIVDLGLVYRVEVAGARLRIEMTMTSPPVPCAITSRAS
jgi:metal-sulfur cluster biosynthetic enzyme